MIELEKLYQCAEINLQGKSQDWDGFAKSFKLAFEARLMLYTPTFEEDVLAWRSSNGLIATTDPEVAAKYIGNKMYEHTHIPEQSLSPLEPFRRTDALSDDQYKSLTIARNFYLPNNMFYLIASIAVLRDSSHLILVAARSEQQSDFSDIEKQRLSLFMRYLATFLRTPGSLVAQASETELTLFGERYALTNTEVRILAALLQGYSLRNIAQESGRSYGTMRWHVQNILGKCQVKTQQNLLNEFYQLIKS